MARTRRAWLIALLSALALASVPGTAIAKSKKPILVGSGTISVILPSPVHVGSNYSYTGTLTASKGCQTGRNVRLTGAGISPTEPAGGPPSHPDGTFAGSFGAADQPASGPVQATVARRALFKHGTVVTRHGRFVVCKAITASVGTLTVVSP